MIRHWPTISLGVLLLFVLVRAWIPLPGQPEAAAAAVIAMVHVALWMARRHELEWSPLIWFLAAMPMVAVAQVLARSTLDPSATAAEAVMRSGLAIVFFLALQVRRVPVREIAGFAGALAIASPLMHWARREASPEFWLFPNHNHYAAFMELLFPVALYRALVGKGLRWEAVAALAIFVSVLLSGSRFGSGVMFAEFVAVCVLAGKWDKRLAVLVAAALIVGVAAQWQRYEEVLRLKPFVERASNTETTLEMIRQQPLAGVGLGAWYAAFPRYTRFDPGFDVFHADNDWLEWASEGGVWFPLLWLPLLWSVIRGLRARPWTVGILAACLHGLAEYPLHKLPVIYCLLAMWGLASRASKQSS